MGNASIGNGFGGRAVVGHHTVGVVLRGRFEIQTAMTVAVAKVASIARM